MTHRERAAAALQTGTEEEVVASAEYCLTYGKPHGGYIFCTSNVPFKGMPPERALPAHPRRLEADAGILRRKIPTTIQGGNHNGFA